MKAEKSKKRRRMIPFAAGFLGIMVLALYAGALSAVLRGAKEDSLSPASAIVVFGSYVKPGSKPGPEVLSRAARGVALCDAGLGVTLAFSGGRVRGGEPVGRIMAELASQSDLSAPNLLLDEESVTLEQCVTKVAQLARAQDWDNVIFVAGRLETARARLLFERHGLPMLAAPPIRLEQVEEQGGAVTALSEAAMYIWNLLFYRG